MLGSSIGLNLAAPAPALIGPVMRSDGAENTLGVSPLSSLTEHWTGQDWTGLTGVFTVKVSCSETGCDWTGVPGLS